MRLINVNTRKLEEFYDAAIPRYSILSHTWGREEVSYSLYLSTEYLVNNSAGTRSGYQSSAHGFDKIEHACQQSRLNKIEYTWVDTCCIDKSSSADLSEAINSMFSWYQKSAYCYVHLEDVTAPAELAKQQLLIDHVLPQLPKSRWFTRGWTLQELLAPRHVIFFSREWQWIDILPTLAESIAPITGIDTAILLQRESIQQRSIAERMSWAAKRKTTRSEDMAYCLLGIMDVNMPLLYGEGHRAFLRLQEEIMKITSDTTILTWTPRDPSDNCLLLAPYPDRFKQGSKYISPESSRGNIGHVMGSTGLQIELAVSQSQYPGYWLARLSTFKKGSLKPRDAAHLWLQSSHRASSNPPMYHISSPERPRFELGSQLVRELITEPKMIVIAKNEPNLAHSQKWWLSNTQYIVNFDEEIAPSSPMDPEVLPNTANVDRSGLGSSSPSMRIYFGARSPSFGAVSLPIRDPLARKLGLKAGEKVCIAFGRSDKHRNDDEPDLLGIMQRPASVTTDDWLLKAVQHAHSTSNERLMFPSPRMYVYATHQLCVAYTGDHRMVKVTVKPR